MKKYFIAIVAAFMVTPAGALEVKDPNRIIMEVKGVVCSFCAYGLSKNLSKLKMTDKSFYKKGVFTDIEKGLVTVALIPNQPIDFKGIQKKIKKGGYDLEAIHLAVKGSISKVNTDYILVAALSGQTFVLDSPANSVEDEVHEIVISIENLNNFKKGSQIHAHLKTPAEIQTELPSEGPKKDPHNH